MILRMTIIGEVKPPDPQDVSRSFGSQGGRIGRGLSNEWVLPDPHMSKNHCSIQCRDGQFSLTDTSTNGVFVNGSPERVERGATVAINDGDSLKIGDYEISVEIDETAGAAEADSIEDQDSFARVLGVGLGENLDPFEINSQQRAKDAPDPIESEPQSRGEDPLDALLDRPAEKVAGEDPLIAPPGPMGPVIPDDDDLLGDLLPKATPDAGAEPPGRVSSEQDHVPTSNEFFQPPGVVGTQIPDDWDLDDDDLLKPEAGPEKASAVDAAPAAPRAAEPAPSVPEPAPPVQAPPVQAPSVQAPPVQAPSAQTPPAQTRAAPAASVSEADGALIRAFLEGAGMAKLSVPEADQIEMMRSVGETYRDLVRGLIEVLKVRQTIKNEFRLDQTMIRAEDNNPLKFKVNVDEALRAMLEGTEVGYLSPRQAVDQGFSDIKAHQIAVMAGMQVALKALLMRFDPKELEDRMREESVLDKVLPGSKKARHWELFTKFYAEIAKEAEDDFHGLFGREFARAYEEQAKKV